MFKLKKIFFSKRFEAKKRLEAKKTTEGQENLSLSKRFEGKTLLKKLNKFAIRKADTKNNC